MRILVDMNLSPLWVDVFRRENWEAVHWSPVGDSAATDAEILHSAAESESIIFTHDLDFGALLASSTHRKPSVIQLRSQETSPAVMGAIVVLALKQLATELQNGALDHRPKPCACPASSLAITEPPPR